MFQKISLFLIIIALLTVTALVLMFLSRKTIEPAITIPSVAIPTTTLSLSPPLIIPENELIKLWMNGERCPKKDFEIPVQKIKMSSFQVNKISIDFKDNVDACEKTESIALVVEAQIFGFEKARNTYSLKIPAQTIEEMEALINKIKQEKDPAIEEIFPWRDFSMPYF